MYFPLMLYKVNENKYIQIGFMGTYLICIKWHFVSVFNGDLSAAVHIFSSLNSSITIKGMAMTLLGIHVEFNTKRDQLSLMQISYVEKSFQISVEYVLDLHLTVDTEALEN